MLGLVGAAIVAATVGACRTPPGGIDGNGATVATTSGSPPDTTMGTGAATSAATTETSEPPPTTTSPLAALITVIGRQGWQARPPGEGLQPHRVDRVTVHHTAALLEDNADAPGHIRGHQAFHIDTRGWPDLAYHFIVDAAGNVYEGRDSAMRGDTATDYDPTGHLLVCCEGDFDRQPLPDPQRHSLEAMLAWGVSTYGLTVDTIAGHGDYASTNCPGAALRDLLDDGTLHQSVTDLLHEGPLTLDILTGDAAVKAVASIEGA